VSALRAAPLPLRHGALVASWLVSRLQVVLVVSRAADLRGMSSATGRSSSSRRCSANGGGLMHFVLVHGLEYWVGGPYRREYTGLHI
jgi:hypothetical protein